MKATEKLLDAVIKRTRADAMRSLESQIVQGRRFDSNSFSYQPPHKTATSVSELVSTFTSLGLIEEEDVRSTAAELHDQEEEVEVVFRGRRFLAARS